MRRLLALATILFAAGAASAQALTWPELMKRPEFWPKSCALKRPLQFQSGKGVKGGQKLDVLSMQPNQIEAGALGMGFTVKPEDTDCLEVAQAEWNALSPSQRQITYATAVQRRELWPYRVALTEPIELSGPDGRLPVGHQVVLMGVDRTGKLSVITERTSTGFEIPVETTDLLQQVRKYVDDPSGPPSRVAGELAGRLVNPITGAAAPLDDRALPRYYLLFRGGGWCPYTRALAPDVVKFYKEMKPKHPEFEAIYLPVDKSAAEMQQYAKTAGFPWPAVAFNRSKDFHVLAPLLGPVPQLIVVDNTGKVVIDDTDQKSQTVLTKLAALLTQTAEAR